MGSLSMTITSFHAKNHRPPERRSDLLGDTAPLRQSRVENRPQ